MESEFVTNGRVLVWTGHQTAIAVAFALCMLGCLMVLSVEPLKWVDLNRPLGPWVLLSGFGLAIPAFIGLCVFVRCPRCDACIVWHAVSRAAYPRAYEEEWEGRFGTCLSQRLSMNHGPIMGLSR
jgi:hypothetical protein